MNYTTINVGATATLNYTESRTDIELAYTKTAGGTVTVAAGVIFESEYCTFGGIPISTNDIGAAYFIDTVAVGGEWRVYTSDITELWLDSLIQWNFILSDIGNQNKHEVR